MSDQNEELHRKMQQFDCPKCPNRTDAQPHPTNKGTTCRIGFTQNPRTVEGARNLLANGGKLCFRHPMKYVYERG